MKDRAMEALYLLALQPVAETTADKNSYGFRPERSTADAREQCFTVLAHRACAQWILEGDIRACFEEISHDWMLAKLPLDKAMLRKWLKTGFIEKGRLFPTERSTPQGSPLSPTLANMTLDGLEAELQAHFGQKGTPKKAKCKVNVCRFADDFVVTGATQELLEHEVKPVIEWFLSERGLELSKEKTHITHIEEGFDFLGWNFRKYDGTLLIKPAKDNIKAVLKKIRGIVKANQATRQEWLIKQLNPVIRGWTNYHRVAVAKKTFNAVDDRVWRLLWQWARRRHPHKGLRWIKDRYFKNNGWRNWVFATDQVELVKTRHTKIRRHVKIRGDANPFDPEWETYFERRLRLQMEEDLKGRRRLLWLWKKQAGRCPNCRQPLKPGDIWEIHHIVPKAEGGRDNSSNLQMLHLNCHRQVHSRAESEPDRVPTRTFVKA